MLKVEGLHAYIGEFHIIQGVSLEVAAGKVTVILGRNGAGKTSTLRSILGLIPARRGKIQFEGQSLLGLPPYLIARKGLGYVPEDQGIFASLTVEENFRLAMLGKKAEPLLEKVLTIFPDLKVALRKKAGALSGGQKQMLALGRAMVANSRLLLIDEPSKGLAPVIVEKVAEVIQQMKEEKTILLVEQNFNLAQKVGDFYYIIDDGRTVQSGKMQDLADDPALQQRFLGVTVKKP